MFQRGPWLGQVPLVLGPSSWGAGMTPMAPLLPAVPSPIPPFYGEWGYVNPDGDILDSGTVGPFNTPEEAFSAAAREAAKHGAMALPTDGFAQVVDSRGQSMGPVT